jgi:hypothetical protein
VIDEHPNYQELLAKKAKHEEAKTSWRQRIARLQSEYDRQMAEWRPKAEAALLEGKPQPPQPQKPDLGRDDALQVFEVQRQQLVEEERQVLIEIAPEIEQQVAQLCRAEMEKAAKPAKQLEGHADVIQGAQREVQRVRLAIDGANSSSHASPGQGFGERTPVNCTAWKLLDALRDPRVSLLGPEVTFTPEPEPAVPKPMPEPGDRGGFIGPQPDFRERPEPGPKPRPRNGAYI